MIWHYSRGKERIRIENQYDKQAAEFVLHIDHPGGYRETKRFADARAFRSWLSAFEDQLVARHWMPLQVLVEEASPVAPSPSGTDIRSDGREVPAVVTKTYTSGLRTFEILLSRRVVKGVPAWTVERVMETSVAKRVTISGVQAISSTTADETFARVCDCIDKWVWADQLEPATGVCVSCGSVHTRIVGQSGWPPTIHRRCEDCGHVSSRQLDD
jgi:hypothetical protein